MKFSREPPSIAAAWVGIFLFGLLTLLGFGALFLLINGEVGDERVEAMVFTTVLLSASFGVVVCARRLLEDTKQDAAPQPIGGDLSAIPRTKLTLRSVYWDASGRCSRSTYWLFGFLPVIAFEFIALTIMLNSNMLGTHATPPFWIFVAEVLISVPTTIVAIKRLHDLNKSGWTYLLVAVPIVGMWILIQMFFFRGSPGWNRFGPP